MEPTTSKKYLGWAKNIGIGLIGLTFAVFIFALKFDHVPSVFDSEVVDQTSQTQNSSDEVCESVPITLSDKTVLLRIDDIQAYTWHETSFRMITDAEERGIPLTLSVIPKGLSDDVELVSFLKEHACNLEFALHGWDHGASLNHELPEFLHLNRDAAAERVERGLSVLEELTDEPIVTWVPPQNAHSSGTAAAVKELGFEFISTEGEEKWDYDATTYDYGTNELLEVETVVSSCEEQLKTDNTCIVMLHPQNFTDGPDHNEALYQEYYIKLLDELQAKGYSFARFKDFSESKNAL